jgi:hypothetical protein
MMFNYFNEYPDLQEMLAIQYTEIEESFGDLSFLEESEEHCFTYHGKPVYSVEFDGNVDLLLTLDVSSTAHLATCNTDQVVESQVKNYVVTISISGRSEEDVLRQLNITDQNYSILKI